MRISILIIKYGEKYYACRAPDLEAMRRLAGDHEVFSLEGEYQSAEGLDRLNDRARLEARRLGIARVLGLDDWRQS